MGLTMPKDIFGRDRVVAALDSMARRSAMRAGLRAKKLRDGGYRLVNGRNRVVAGERYDLEAQQVIDFCREREARGA